MITPNIVANLIEIGRRASVDNIVDREALAALADQDHINGHGKDWDFVTAALSDADLINLVKGLTIAESYFRWTGGSVAAAIWVFRELLRRGDSKTLSETAKWVYEHRWNEYLPFSSTRYWSYEDYVYRNSAEYRAEQAKKLELIEQSKIAQRQARIKRRAELILKHREVGVRKAEARFRAIQKLSQLTNPDRWFAIAIDKSVTLDFYPTEWAAASESELRTLPLETVDLLIDRLGVRSKRPWRELRQRLVRIRTG